MLFLHMSPQFPDDPCEKSGPSVTEGPRPAASACVSQRGGSSIHEDPLVVLKHDVQQVASRLSRPVANEPFADL